MNSIEIYNRDIAQNRFMYLERTGTMKLKKAIRIARETSPDILNRIYVRRGWGTGQRMDRASYLTKRGSLQYKNEKVKAIDYGDMDDVSLNCINHVFDCGSSYSKTFRDTCLVLSCIPHGGLSDPYIIITI